MTTRKHTARRPGPITLGVDTTAIDVHITASTTGQASITIHTDDNSGPSADIVRNAIIDDRADGILVRFPDEANTGGMIVNAGRGTIIVGNNHGVVIGGNGTMRIGGSRVTFTAALPAGSSLAAKTKSGDVTADAQLQTARVETMSGDIRLREVHEPMLKTMSGDITVSGLLGSGSANSMSGDVKVHALAPCSFSASTMSGDIGSSGPVQLAGSSMSGRVRRQ